MLKIQQRSEKEIENEILFLLNIKYKIPAMKLNNIGIFDTQRKIFRRNTNKWIIKGVPDIWAMKNGRSFWIEVKSKTGKQSPEQKAFEIWVKSEGIIYFICRSESDLIENLKLHKFIL